MSGPSEDPPELELTFPCSWSYTVVVEHESQLQEALVVALAGEPYTVGRSRASSKGRYSSYHVEVEVASDERRLMIFRVLHEHPGIQYVL